jgi:hypothetical protein
LLFGSFSFVGEYYKSYKYIIPYGKENIKVNVPDDYEILVPKRVSIKDEDKLIEQALENPIGFNSFDEFNY